MIPVSRRRPSNPRKENMRAERMSCGPDAERETSLARTAKARKWGAFRGEAGEEEAEGPDRDWSGFVASDPAVHEVNDSLKIIDVWVAPSPHDGVVGQALKLGDEELAETLSVMFAVAM